jgi:hypothetical protein
LAIKVKAEKIKAVVQTHVDAFLQCCTNLENSVWNHKPSEANFLLFLRFPSHAPLEQPQIPMFSRVLMQFIAPFI